MDAKDAKEKMNNTLRSPRTWRLKNFSKLTPWPPLFRGKRGGINRPARDGMQIAHKFRGCVKMYCQG